MTKKIKNSNSFMGMKRIRINLILAGAGFGIFYWMIDSIQDVLVFGRGTITERIFSPDCLTLWMRLLVVFILVLFGAYTQSLRNRLKNSSSDFLNQTFGHMIFNALLFGVIYWILESVRDSYAFDKGTFLQCLLHPEQSDFWVRILAVLIIFLFSAYVQTLIDERKKVESTLNETRNQLEKEVLERTEALSCANQQLQSEITDRIYAENKLREVNRALKTIKDCNEVLIRAIDEKHLLQHICDTIITSGGYRLVWVTYPDHRNNHYTIKAKSALHEADLEILNSGIMEQEAGELPEIKAIQTGKRQMFNEISKISNPSKWIEHARQKNYDAFLALPLKKDNSIYGSLNIFSCETHRFDQEEVALLEELSNDMAFGIQTLRTRIKHSKAEKEKEGIQEQLIHSQKMEAIGVLAGGVAHDFNNLLTAIQVSTDLAMMQLPRNDPVFQDLSEIHQVAKSAADLAKQLLLFSRKHPMEFKTLTLNESVKNLQKMLRRMIRENVQLETDLAENLWTVWGDRGTVEQVIMNLVINARDAMPNGGKITIRTENIRLNKTNTRTMPEARRGKYVKLTVSDNGIGMDQDVQKHIFEPFFSTKGPSHGTGLGLSVVYGIVKEHDGWIHLNSEVSSGALFEVYLPAVYVKSDAFDLTNVDYKELKGDGKCVLLIEDEAKVREYTVKGLKHNDYTVYSANCIKQAEQIFNEHKDDISHVFCDIGLPDGNGIDFVENIQSQFPNLHVILSSGYVEQHTRVAASKKNSFTYLQKPFALTELLKVMKSPRHVEQ